MSDKKQIALEAIEDLFGDKSLSLREAVDALEEVRDEIDGRIMALKEDLRAGR